MDDHELKQTLKQLLVTECDKEDELSWQEILDDEPLMGQGSRIAMDSLDALQLSLAIQQRYGVRIEGAREARTAFESINALLIYIRNQRQP
jgi:acyl carrier protein